MSNIDAIEFAIQQNASKLIKKRTIENSGMIIVSANGEHHFVLPTCRGAQFKKGSFALCKMAETMIMARQFNKGDIMKCPGQDSQYWKPGAVFDVKCPECGNEVEFFKDDPTRKCSKCGHRFLNPDLDFGCASYCPHAAQCIGNLPPELLKGKEDLLKDRVAIEMKRYFKVDFKRIGHASRVARYAEQIGREEQGNLAVILSAAYLHDIGIKEAERKYNSTAAQYQEKEGPPIAREILIKLGTAEEIIDEVCHIIGHHHHPEKEETINFKSLYDADLITNLEEAQKEKPSEKEHLDRILKKSFLTDSGRKLAEKTLLK